jgi:protein-S-isoprenylcysteine O-methyltransferase Ste14
MNRLIFARQWLHLLALVVLLAAATLALPWAGLGEGPVHVGETGWWLLLAIRLAVVHQVFVWFCWRTELHARLLSRLFGASAFTVYAVHFVILGGARLAAAVTVSWVDRGSLAPESVILKSAALLLLLPVAYLLWSIHRFFGARRAFGADHFDPAVRARPPVREGIFGWTPNAMYTFGFLALWAAALWWSSRAGLIAAAFNHLYIWVHWFATEEPDLRRMHAADDVSSA